MKLRLAIGFLFQVAALSAFAQWPKVTIATPVHGQTFSSSSVLLSVNTSDTDGTVEQVDYFIDGVFIESVRDPSHFETFANVDWGRHKLHAVAYDNIGYWTVSASTYFQVGGEFPVNILRGPYLQMCNSTSVVVRWRTDWPTNSIVRFSTDASFALSKTNNTRTSEHEVLVTGLTPNTIYNYRVGSTSEMYEEDAPQTFRAAPTNTRPFRAWVIGDFGTGGSEQAAVRDAYLALHEPQDTDVWLMLGDNAYESGTDEEYQIGVFDMYNTFLSSVPAWPTIGNHDAAVVDEMGRIAYMDIFTLPTNGAAGGIPSGTERYYSFDYANVHFICLDSEMSDRATNGPMLNWLREDLAATDKDWIVAFWHRPPYSSSTHFSDIELPMVEMRERVGPILEAHGVDLVLAGHSHAYERSYLIDGHYGYTNSFTEEMKIDGTLGNDADAGPYRKPAGGLGANRGTVYAVCGNSGQGSYGHPFFYGYQPCMVRNLGGFGSMILEFDHLRLNAKFLREDGTVDDYFSIDKSSAGSVRPELKMARSMTGMELTWPTSVPAFALESAPKAQADGGWQMVTNAVARSGRRNKMSLGFSATNQFFRLRRGP